MRVSNKGQVTIPIDVRRKLGFAPGVQIALAVDGDQVKLRRADRGNCSPEEFEAWLKNVRGTGDSGLTTEEIMEMTRGRFDDANPG